MPFAQLGLEPELLRAIKREGYETPTPIQEKAIPAINAGKDLFGCAQTGTGKTAAFAWPILQRLKAARTKRLRALVLTPTRELAVQVAESFRSYGCFLSLRIGLVYGGVSLSLQEKELHRGVDVLIATPGRLLDHMSRGNVDFKHVEFLVLDEADRMLDMGFIDDVKRILQFVPKKRQTLLFSATMPQPIRQLAQEILRDPVEIQVTRPATPVETVRQTVHAVATWDKAKLLNHLLENQAMSQVLVFTRTRRGAESLTRFLNERGKTSISLHGDKSQAERTKALNAFRAGHYGVLVATDVAARGLDVEGISHVVNYDVPETPENYVHRIGRTARAGESGDAITFVAPEESSYMRAIEHLIGQSIPEEAVEGYSLPPAVARPVKRIGTRVFRPRKLLASSGGRRR
ncbi:MAG TPA: DEAD/DEAH box helicase [bacterium]|nr:DEAD/DEAH box helicase [bacterium]